MYNNKKHFFINLIFDLKYNLREICTLTLSERFWSVVEIQQLIRNDLQGK